MCLLCLGWGIWSPVQKSEHSLWVSGPGLLGTVYSLSPVPIDWRCSSGQFWVKFRSPQWTANASPEEPSHSQGWLELATSFLPQPAEGWGCSYRPPHLAFKSIAYRFGATVEPWILSVEPEVGVEGEADHRMMCFYVYFYVRVVS